jgi:maleate cis-trans isomerase
LFAAAPAPPREVIVLVNPWYRLGYVIPHLHTDMDAYQFYKVAPDGVMLVTTQLNLAEYSLAAVERELPTFWERVDVLAGQSVDLISLSGVPVASVLGRDRVLALLDEVRGRTGLPADTDAEAHIAAFHHLGLTKVAVSTRWPSAVTDALMRYLGDAGIEVVACRSRPRNLTENKKADPAEDHELALELGREVLRSAPEAQALMLPGGLWYAVHAVPVLEAEFGIPVTLNITATLWAGLHARKGALLRRPDSRWGMLLGSL